MPRVAFYTFFQGGGIGRYTVELLKRLATCGDLELKLLCSKEFECQEIEGVNVEPVMFDLAHPNSMIRRSRFLTAQWVNPRRLVQEVREEGIEIIHFSSYNYLTYPFWRKALRRTGVKIVVSAHDVLRQNAILCRPWENRQLAAFYHDADAIMVHSEFQAEQLADFASVPRNKVKIVPHGPYDYDKPSKSKIELRESYGISQSVCLGLFFGQLRDEKNLEGLLRAWPGEQSNLHLLVAGRGGGKHKGAAYYQALVKDLRLKDQVTFLDRFIEEGEVGDLFKIADWLALPYDASFVSQSGVLNIAGAFDLPILVGDAPVMKETVEQFEIGISSPMNDLSSGIKAISRAVSQGQQFAFETYRQKNSWQENARITAELYRELLTSNL